MKSASLFLLSYQENSLKLNVGSLVENRQVQRLVSILSKYFGVTIEKYFLSICVHVQRMREVHLSLMMC